MLTTKEALLQFIESIKEEFDIFIPMKNKNGDYLSLVPYATGKEWVFTATRPSDPLKILFYPPREQILPLKTVNKKRIIFGVKNCDLNALTILDRALLEDRNFTDLNYRQWRESTYIIGADCSEILPACHCNLLGLKPYPQLNSDLNMSEVKAGYQLEVKTPKGEEIIDLMRKHLSLTDTKINAQEVQENRERICDLLTAQNQNYPTYKRDRENLNNPEENLWSKTSGTCVECGGCSYICPTCYCIMINDQTVKTKEFLKIKTWDSCQHTGYAKVAGGGTPRPKLWQRFRHRYLCKFSVMKDNFSELGCTGCGRCISCCPAGIDIRENGWK